MEGMDWHGMKAIQRNEWSVVEWSGLEHGLELNGAEWNTGLEKM